MPLSAMASGRSGGSRVSPGRSAGMPEAGYTPPQRLFLDDGECRIRFISELDGDEFGDGVAESEQSTATTLDLLNRAGAVSTATKVKILHPDWDESATKAEVAAILAETGAGAPDLVGTFPM